MNPPSWPCGDGVPPSHAVVMPDESAISICWLNGFAWSTIFSSPRRAAEAAAERAARAHGDETGRDVLVARVEDACVVRDLHVAADLDDLVVAHEHRALADDGPRHRVDRAVHDREERVLGGLRLGPAVRARVGAGVAAGIGTGLGPRAGARRGAAAETGADSVAGVVSSPPRSRAAIRDGCRAPGREESPRGEGQDAISIKRVCPGPPALAGSTSIGTRAVDDETSARPTLHGVIRTTSSRLKPAVRQAADPEDELHGVSFGSYTVTPPTITRARPASGESGSAVQRRTSPAFPFSSEPTSFWIPRISAGVSVTPRSTASRATPLRTSSARVEDEAVVVLREGRLRE